MKKIYDENGQEVQSNEQTIEIVANDEQMDSKINSHDKRLCSGKCVSKWHCVPFSDFIICQWLE